MFSSKSICDNMITGSGRQKVNNEGLESPKQKLPDIHSVEVKNLTPDIVEESNENN